MNFGEKFKIIKCHGIDNRGIPDNIKISNVVKPIHPKITKRRFLSMQIILPMLCWICPSV